MQLGFGYLSNFHILLVYLFFFLFPHLFVFSPLPVRECGNELWSGGRVQWGQRVASRPATDSWVEMFTGLSPLCTFGLYGSAAVRAADLHDLTWQDGWVVITPKSSVRTEGKDQSLVHRSGKNMSTFLWTWRMQPFWILEFPFSANKVENTYTAFFRVTS